jgi:hypothetical protein
MGDKYRFGDFTAENVAIGSKARVITKGSSARERAKALKAIQELVELASDRAVPAREADNVRQAAAALEVAVNEKKLKRDVIRNSLESLVAVASGIMTLTHAVEVVQAAIARLLG